MHTKLSVNSSETMIMLVNSQKRDKPCIMYNNEPLECVESFKYLGLEVPSNHRWNECATRRLKGGKRTYYAFENTCNRGGIVLVRQEIPFRHFGDTDASPLGGRMGW